MPVRRFRDLEEARRALWTTAGDPSLPVRLRRLWSLAARLAPLGSPRGVRKFRHIEDANRERDEWVARRVRALRAQRTRGDPAASTPSSRHDELGPEILP